MTGILGKKLGMTQIFAEDGSLIAVTAIEAGPCFVLAVKEKSLQLGFEKAKEGSVNKPLSGYFKKLNLPPLKFIREVPKEAGKEYKIGDEIKVDIFNAGDWVDVTGISKGKGFQGGMKRWGWKGGPQTHGSMSHRRPGSIGSTTTPGRVWKGHHMPGHMGCERVTVQNLKVVKTDPERNLLLVKGAVPGNNNSYVMIRKTKKQRIVKKVTPQAAKKETKK